MRIIKWILVIIGAPMLLYGFATEPDTLLSAIVQIIGGLLVVVGLSYILGFLPLGEK